MRNTARRGRFLRGLRKVHGWLGLWGAVLGLLFGVSGFLLNHRAVLKIPAAQMEESEIQLQVPQPQPANSKEFARFIQQALDIRQDPVQRKAPKGSAERDARFMGKDMKQPANLEVNFQLPQAAIHAEYVVGNQFATVKREDANVWGFIMRMHKGVGANAAWVLLADSIAGALMLLSITGVLLWTKMRGSRLVMSALIGSSVVLSVWVTLTMM
jgi:hypothetical protein